MVPIKQTTDLIQDMIATWPKLARTVVALFLFFPMGLWTLDKAEEYGLIANKHQLLLESIVSQHQQQINADHIRTRAIERSLQGIDRNRDDILRTGEKNFQAGVANCFVNARSREDRDRCERLVRTGKGE